MIALPASPLAFGRHYPWIGTLAAGVIGSQIAPTADGDVTCLLRIHAHTACPGCGMSRACGQLLEGNVAASVAYNPFFLLASVQVIAFVAWRLWRGHEPLTNIQSLRLTYLALANALAILAIWIIRLTTGHIDHVYA